MVIETSKKKKLVHIDLDMGERLAIVTLLLIAAFLAAAVSLHFFGGRAVLGHSFPN